MNTVKKVRIVNVKNLCKVFNGNARFEVKLLSGILFNSFVVGISNFLQTNVLLNLLAKQYIFNIKLLITVLFIIPNSSRVYSHPLKNCSYKEFPCYTVTIYNVFKNKQTNILYTLQNLSRPQEP